MKSLKYWPYDLSRQKGSSLHFFQIQQSKLPLNDKIKSISKNNKDNNLKILAEINSKSARKYAKCIRVNRYLTISSTFKRLFETRVP